MLTKYSWVLDPYLGYLREECQLMERTIQQARAQLCTFRGGLGEKITRKRTKLLRSEGIETYVKQHLKDSRENLQRLVGTLRRFLRYCARQGYTTSDLSGVIPSILSYRLATLPKGMGDSALQRILNVIPKDPATGARDYAIMLLMMAYGIRGKSAAALLLEDICWPRSTIRIRAQKGGKEVVLPLLEAVGEAILCYLRHRFESPFWEVFLSARAPFRPLYSLGISMMIRRYILKAGVKMSGSGSHTLRYSWAIRVLAQDSPMKAIADVLGHRCSNNTFILPRPISKRFVRWSCPGRKGGDAMSTCIFGSPLAFWLQAFLETRCALGRKGDYERKILTHLDRFLMSELKLGQIITPNIVDRWIKNLGHLSVGTRINRISVLRQFCFSLSHFDPRPCLVHRSFLPQRTCLVPHICSRQEVRSIMNAAKQIAPIGSLRPAGISTLIGLLHSTGLRIGEALKLTLEDVDLRGQLLTIRETKFKKSRYAPLSPSTVHHLTGFLRQRSEAGFSLAPTAPVFVNPQGPAYGHP